MAIKQHKIKIHSQEWYNFRLNGIGSSDVSAILTLSDYKSSLETYHEKIGFKPQDTETSKPAYRGIKLEPMILDTWQYYDGTDDGYIQNEREDKIIRKCSRPGAYFINDKYPWLFVSPDGLTIPGSFAMIEGFPELEKACPIEAKSIMPQEMRKWEHGVPPGYLAQVYCQNIVTETRYGELFMFDFNNFNLFPVQLNRKYASYLLEETEKFWKERVVPGKQLVKEMNTYEMEGNRKAVREAQGEIDNLEPPPDNSPAYAAYKNKQYQEEELVMLGNDEQFFLCQETNLIKAIVKSLGRIELKNKNILRAVMKEYQVLDFEGAGRVTWKSGEKSTRTMNIRLKETPDPEKVKAIVNLIQDQL